MPILSLPHVQFPRKVDFENIFEMTGGLIFKSDQIHFSKYVIVLPNEM